MTSYTVVPKVLWWWVSTSSGSNIETVQSAVTPFSPLRPSTMNYKHRIWLLLTTFTALVILMFVCGVVFLAEKQLFL